MTTETKTQVNALIPMSDDFRLLIDSYIDDKGFDNFDWEDLFEDLNTAMKNVLDEDSLYAAVHFCRTHWSRTGSKKPKWTDADKQVILDFFHLGSLPAHKESFLRYEREKTLRLRARTRNK
jgi:hypothetical protein